MLALLRRRFIACGTVLPLLTLAAIAPARADAAMAQKLLDAKPAHGERSLGAADAPVVMIEYASATCPHCAEFHVKVWPTIKAEYVDTGKVRFVFREFPLENTAMGAFMLARCAPEEAYFATIDAMFAEQDSWVTNPKDGLYKIVAKAGLAEKDADACLDRQDLAQSIYNGLKKASDEFGVKGTPTFFVDGVKIDGHEDTAAVRKALDAALAAKAVK